MPIYFGNQQVDPSGISAAYVGETQVYSEGSAQSEYLYFENTSDSTGNVTLSKYGSSSFSVFAKLDDGSWSQMTTGNARTIPAGSRLYVECRSGSSSSLSYIYFAASNIAKIGGNLASMGGGGTYDFLYMFRDMTSLTDASELFFSGSYGYSSLFSNTFNGCTNLIKGPHIIMDDIQANCFSVTFSGCSSLKVSSSEVEGAVPLIEAGSMNGTNSNTFRNTAGTYTSGVTANHTYYWYL